MMTATSRYWDCERCAWVSYEPSVDTAGLSGPELAGEALPGQRIDEETVPEPLAT